MGISMSINFYSQIQIQIFTHNLFIDRWIITLPHQPAPSGSRENDGCDRDRPPQHRRRGCAQRFVRSLVRLYRPPHVGCRRRRHVASRLIDNERRRYYSNPKAKWLHTDEKMPCARGGGGCNNQSKFVAQICFKELDQSMQLLNTLYATPNALFYFIIFKYTMSSKMF
jgi:hypothetical protein